jgi:hypothetical protein
MHNPAAGLKTSDTSPEEPETDRGAARGIVFGLLFSAILWLLLALTIYHLRSSYL